MRLKVLFFLLYAWSLYCVHPPIVCRDPDVGGTAQNMERKFLIFGTDDSGGAGLGNMLIFFPAAFYFAALTGRDILIADGSVLGEMCRIIHCGFPHLKYIAPAFPRILTEDAIQSAEMLKFQDFQRYMEGSRKADSKVVRATGFLPKSDWWIWFNFTVPCVTRITGCDPGDVMCAERHAYQRLIRGPFMSSFTSKEEARIIGVPTYLKHSLLTLPHSYSPRLDIAVHLRAQFHHFEQHTDVSDPAYKQEVQAWLNGSECEQVFSQLKDQLLHSVAALRGAKEKSKEDSKSKDKDPVYIYLASDNEDVKDAFVYMLGNTTKILDQALVMRVDSPSIYHIKNMLHDNVENKADGLLDLVFDWYALSLANTIYAWRKGSTNMI
eukprot:gene27819-33595_t